jgi:CRP-like cAMP-binding protein
MAQKPARRTKKSRSNLSADGKLVRNTILLQLSSDCAGFLSRLKFVPLAQHTVLQEAGEEMKTAYFVNTGVVSVLTVMEDGNSVEVGLIGSDGFASTAMAAGFHASPTRAVVQIAGDAFQISRRDLQASLSKCPGLERQLNRFAQLLGVQVSQVAGCNRLHDLGERLAKWLLMCQDRLESNVIPLTHEFLAQMLGTGRSSVTIAAGILQRAGLVHYSRGTVTILDRAGLEDAACECYAAINEYNQ